MSIRNRLLVLLLVIALTPLVVTSLLQQASIWVARDRLASNARQTQEDSARQELREWLRSDAEILELDRQLADAQLQRQVREVEQRLAGITPPPRRGPGERSLDPNAVGAPPPGGLRPPNGPPMDDRRFDPNAREAGARGRGGPRGNFPGEAGGRGPGPGNRPPAVEFALANVDFGLDPNLSITGEWQHPTFDSSRTSARPSSAESGSNETPQTRSLVVSDSNASPSDPNALKVNYKAQSCFIVRGDDETRAKQAMEKLASMTSVYKDICMRGPTGILWLHTSLGTGLHLTYPGGATPRNLSRYNPLRTEWYMQASGAYENQKRLESGGASRTPPGDAGRRRGGPGDPRWERMFRERQIGIEAIQGVLAWDPFTTQMVVVRSMPVTYANGDFAGAVAMVRTIPEIFSSLQLPERWGTDIERMLILVDPNAVDPNGKPTLAAVERLLEDGGESEPGAPRTQEDRAGRPEGLRRGGLDFGAARPGFAGTSRGGGRRPRSLAIDPNELPTLALIIEDIAKDQAGVRQMGYNGRQCLVAYQPLDIPQVAAVLVVPYASVVKLASTLERSLLKESRRWLQITPLLLLAVGIAAVILAAMKARNLTRPINALIEAGKQLGSGDYDARVDIRTSDELEHLGRVFNEAGPKLRDHERMKRSLELASAIQQSLLPGETPELRNFELAGRCVYCDETGGDYYDFIHLPAERGRRIGLAIGDVSGHGIGAALLMAVTRGLLHAEVPHTGDDLATLMTRLNRELVHDTAEETFVTLFYGILDDSQRSLVWASAGHEPALWYHASNGQIEELPNTGMLLGVLPNAAYKQAGPVTLAPGDVLVLGTDGIWEAHDDGRRFFGKDRLHQIVQDTAGLSAEGICDRIIDAVAMFVQPASHTDDITLIVVKARS